MVELMGRRLPVVVVVGPMLLVLRRHRILAGMAAPVLLVQFLVRPSPMRVAAVALTGLAAQKAPADPVVEVVGKTPPQERPVRLIRVAAAVAVTTLGAAPAAPASLLSRL
jgi:hypothetical protein